MKIFIINASSFLFRDVALELKKKDIDIAYWTGYKHTFDSFSQDRQNFPETIFHNLYDAAKGIPAPGVDESVFEPPGKNLIQDMLECESIVLTMMTRMDYSNMALIEKKRLYYEYLRYWNGILKVLKPNAIIFYKVPHAVYNFVLYSLAKRYNISTIIFGQTGLENYMILTHDHKDASIDLFEEYDKIKNEKYDIKELGASSQNYLQKLLDPMSDATPNYKKKRISKMEKPNKLLPYFSTIIKNVKSKIFLKTSYFYFKTIFNSKSPGLNISMNKNINYKNIFHLRNIRKIKEEFKKEYISIQSDIDLKNRKTSEKYIYFPLHYQPECTTSPLADFFVDQNLIVEILSFSLPENWSVYVKENIVQWDQHDPRAHLMRYRGYYKKIQKLKNVHLVPPDLSTYDLISNCQAVATATGTAGWEGLVKSKPVLVFGYPWYMYCEGVFRVYDTKTCKSALQEIIEGYKPIPQKVLNYLIALEKLAIKGNWSDRQWWLDPPKKEVVENITNILHKKIITERQNLWET